jgi:hypothetical protein
MDEMTDPSSWHYIPHPFPNSRKEIIANLAVNVKRSHKRREEWQNKWRAVKSPEPIEKDPLIDILEGRTSLHIGPVMRTRNRCSKFNKEYSWLVLILNKDGKVKYLLSVEACGILARHWNNGFSSPDFLQRFSWSKERILLSLSGKTNRTVFLKDVKQMELFDYNGYGWDPVWEIILMDGSIYYYHFGLDMFFVIDKKVPWKRPGKRMRRTDPREIAGNKAYVGDTVDDELIILKAI